MRSGRTWWRLVATVALLTVAGVGAAPAAAQTVAPPPDLHCTTPPELIDGSWCDAVRQQRSMATCVPVDRSSAFPAACTKQYRQLQRTCVEQQTVLAAAQLWLCQAFRAAWAGRRTPSLKDGEPPATSDLPTPNTPGAAAASPDATTTVGSTGAGDEDGTSGKADDSTGGASNELTGGSEFCHREGLDATTRERCRQAGSIARSYPLWSYGLDNQIRGGMTEIRKSMASGVNELLVTVWGALLFAVNGVLVMLDWAFSFDLVNRSMAGVAQGLYELHANVLGTWWMSLGIAVAALTGIWNGLVRMRTTQTMAGLAATVALMVVAMVIIQQPQETVGDLSRQANDASLGVWSVAAKGSVRDPDAAFAGTSKQMFDTLVLRPWCALQFGDVGFCLKRIDKACRIEERDWLPDSGPKCDVAGQTVADAWLSSPAGSERRRQLWHYLDKNDGDHAALMGRPESIAARGALLFLIAGGLLGAILLIGGLSLSLLVAALQALILLLFAPAMLIAPCFGDPGRRATVTWLTRLGEAVVRKFVYAIVLAVIMLIATIIAALPSVSFGASWMILFAFWWGALLRRRQLFHFLTPNSDDGVGIGRALGAAGVLLGYRAVRTTTGATRTGTRAVTGLPRRVLGLQRRRRAAATGALAHDASNRLSERARETIRERKEGELDDARLLANRAGTDRERLGRLDGRGAEARGRLTEARDGSRLAVQRLRDARNELTRHDREREGMGNEDTRLGLQLAQLGADRKALERQLAVGGGLSESQESALTARRDAVTEKMKAVEARRGAVRRKMTASDDARGDVAAAVDAADLEHRSAERGVADLNAELLRLDADRAQLRTRLSAPDVRVAENLVERQGRRPVEVGEHEVRDQLAQARAELAGQPARLDNGPQAQERSLMRRVDDPHALRRNERKAARRDVRSEEHRLEEFQRAARAQRRALRDRRRNLR